MIHSTATAGKVIRKHVMYVSRKILETFVKRTTNQGIFESLHRLSLKGMNIGEGTCINEDGELWVLNHVMTKLKAELVTEPFTIFDVGANVGDYTTAVLKTFGPVNRVVSFEPSNMAYETLKVIANGHTNITAENIGLGDEETTRPLYSDSDASGLSSLYKRRLDHFNILMDRAEMVRIRTLDNYCKENHISRVHLLKLDVEGHELSVLRGADSMLRQGAIDFIQFEFGGCNIDSRTYFQDFFYLLNPYYTIYRILKSGLLAIQRYAEIHEVFITTNYLAERR